MITALLTAHPNTTPETLTHLAATRGHYEDVRTAILTHPHLPEDTDLTHLAPIRPAELRAALTHPATTPQRRTTILTGAHTPDPNTLLWRHITTEGDLTPTEIRAAVNAHPATRTTCAMALATNPNTPTDLATPAITHLATHPDTLTYATLMVVIAAAERHGLDLHHLATTLTPGCRGDHLTAYLTDRDTHATTYAQHLTRKHCRSTADWAAAITATSDTHLAVAALNRNHSNDIPNRILASTRLTHLHPQALLALLTNAQPDAFRDAAHHLATADPDTTHTAIQLAITHHTDSNHHTTQDAHDAHFRTLLRRAATNLTTHADTLNLIAHHLPTGTRPNALVADAHYNAALAAHPGTPPTQRTHYLNRAGTSTNPTYTALATITHHLTNGDPRPARTIHTQALTKTVASGAAALIHHYATTTAHTHPHWPTTHTGELTLLTIAPTFTGTLDELITTAHTITT